MTTAVDRMLFRYLRNGSNAVQVTGDYSSAAETFKAQPANAEVWHLSRMLIHIRETGQVAAEDYGAIDIETAGNGLLVQVRLVSDDSVILDLTDGEPIKSNADWARLCYDVDETTFGTGDNFVRVRWTFARTGKTLDITDEQYLCVVANDNFTGLVAHTFMVQGFI